MRGLRMRACAHVGALLRTCAVCRAAEHRCVIQATGQQQRSHCRASGISKSQSEGGMGRAPVDTLQEEVEVGDGAPLVVLPAGEVKGRWRRRGVRRIHVLLRHAVRVRREEQMESSE